MTTLISKNEKEAKNVRATSYELKTDEILLVMSEEIAGELYGWLENNGVSSIHWQPDGSDSENISDWNMGNENTITLTKA